MQDAGAGGERLTRSMTALMARQPGAAGSLHAARPDARRHAAIRRAGQDGRVHVRARSHGRRSAAGRQRPAHRARRRAGARRAGARLLDRRRARFLGARPTARSTSGRSGGRGTPVAWQSTGGISQPGPARSRRRRRPWLQPQSLSGLPRHLRSRPHPPAGARSPDARTIALHAGARAPPMARIGGQQGRSSTARAR